MSHASAVLNPTLYALLASRFGPVQVSNAGQAMIARVVPNPLDGKPRLQIIQHGEQYAISCPYCTDTRFRLSISHRYGQRDEAGRRMTFLAHCFNEDCLSNRENRADLFDTLTAIEGTLERASIRPGAPPAAEARTVEWPGPVTRLDALPGRHVARRYVRSRGFDPDVLARAYGVGYCEVSHYFLARNRLIIPVLERGELRGWQARYIGEPDRKVEGQTPPPRYFTCPGMERRRLLYNLDRARGYRTGVLVEGATDVWSFGPMAIALFGSAMTDLQKRMFLAAFRRRPVVLLLDADAFDSEAVRHLITDFSHRKPGEFAAVRLPDGEDPGSLARDYLRKYVARQARKQGVEVDYRRQG